MRGPVSAAVRRRARTPRMGRPDSCRRQHRGMGKSWSAEYGNSELGVRTDDAPLAESIERELLDVEEHFYERVPAA